MAFHRFISWASGNWDGFVGNCSWCYFWGLTNKLSKKTLLWIGYLYSISAIGSAISSDPTTFAFFRFIGGIGIGISTIAAPAYISEISSRMKEETCRILSAQHCCRNSLCFVLTFLKRIWRKQLENYGWN